MHVTEIGYEHCVSAQGPGSRIWIRRAKLTTSTWETDHQGMLQGRTLHCKSKLFDSREVVFSMFIDIFPCDVVRRKKFAFQGACFCQTNSGAGVGAIM